MCIVTGEWVEDSSDFNDFTDSSSTFVDIFFRFLVSTRVIQTSSMKNLVLSLHTGLLLGVLLLLLGLQLRECLLQDQRVLHLLHQDQGRGVSMHRQRSGRHGSVSSTGETQVYQVIG